MASLTLSQKKARGQTSGWGGWTTISGVDYISADNRAQVVYSADLSLGSSKMTACQVSTNFVCRSSSASHAATVTCYLYTSDPTSSGPATPPSGYVATASYSVTVPYYGLFQTFYFTGLNITSGSKVYFWFVDNNSSAYADDLYNYATGNGYTGTPTCSGTFQVNNMSLSISPTTVTAGNNVGLTVTNGSGTTLTATFKYGSTTLATRAFSTGSATVNCPASWFTTAGVSALQSMTVNVSISGGPNAMSGSFTLQAGDSMKPTMGTASVEIVQGANASAFPNTYIAGISKAKVSVAVSAPTNAAITSVVLSYPGGSNVTASYNSSTSKYEATTAAPVTADTTFTMTATDQRGLTNSASVSITGVVAYTLPSVTVNIAYRCDADGNRTNSGEYYRLRVTATYYTGLSGNSLKKLTAGIKNGTKYNITSGSTYKLSGLTNPKSSYTILITVQDQISEEITKEITLEGMLRNLVTTRSDDGTYFGVGTTPSRTSGASAAELPLAGDFLLGGIPAQTFYTPYSSALDGSSFSKNFLNVDQTTSRAACNAASFFYRPAASESEWSNAPATNDAKNWRGYRFVLWYSATFQMVLVVEFFPYPGRIWSNFYNGSLGWTGWRYTQAVTPSS